jgi:hypothetical protein
MHTISLFHLREREQSLKHQGFKEKQRSRKPIFWNFGGILPKKRPGRKVRPGFEKVFGLDVGKERV